MISSEIGRLIQSDITYQDLTQPFNETTKNQIKDAEFLIRADGIIFNIEGYSHPKEKVVGEVLYAPDLNGDKTIFGQKYRKVTLHKGTYEPIPYPERSKILSAIDSDFNQSQPKPYFAKFKQILPVSDFIAHISSSRSLSRALSIQSADNEKFHRDFENLMGLLGISPEKISLGLTGAPLLGNTVQYHDLDIVFSGSPQENMAIAKTMRDITKHEPQRRLFEGGKGWQIRFFNDLGTLMCTFFTYPNRSIAPLHDFSMEVIEKGITVQGIVSNDENSMYTPSILELKDAIIKKNNQQVERVTTLPIIVYHTASRGDSFNQDVVQAKGALVEINQPNSSYLAVCVVDREGLRNLTPPWEGYYAEPR